MTTPADSFAGPPDPGRAGDLGDLVERLRLLKVWAGDPSYETIKERVNAAWTAQGRPASELARRSTVASCFRPGRRRLNIDLVLAVVAALHRGVGYAAQWRQALRVVGGEVEAASQVRVRDSLPRDPADFTGRADELDELRRASERGDAIVISAIEGMAGVGKTQLAVRAAHLLRRDERFDRVLFVNLRGFHHDPAQPPADPAAVLDGFLRLLGVPGHRIPHDLGARTAAYRDRLAGHRALVVLDNATTAEQVRPAAARDAGLDMTDHADRLDERHRAGLLDSGVELAFSVSYQQALDICRQIGSANGEAWALNGLGEAALATGRPDSALAHHSAASAIAMSIGSDDQLARANHGLGRADHALGTATRRASITDTP